LTVPTPAGYKYMVTNVYIYSLASEPFAEGLHAELGNLSLTSIGSCGKDENEKGAYQSVEP
jgi:hypothetical protein